MLSYLRARISNSGEIAKALIAVAGAVSVSLTLHNWTNTPSILADVAALLVYLIPNAKAPTA